MDVKILSEIVLYRNGCFKKVRRYLEGIHPTRGRIVKGFTGWETIEEKEIMTAIGTFIVIDLTPSIVEFSEVPAGSDLSG